MDPIYNRLARHIGRLSMGYPYNDALPALLGEMFTPGEAAVALAIPHALLPLEAATLDDIAAQTDLGRDQVAKVLDELAAKRMIYSAPLPGGGIGYGLLQIGYGMPQTFFWGGKRDRQAKRMAKRVLKYFTVPTTGKVYGGVATKAFKYSPSGLAVDIPRQGVLPHEEIGPIINAAEKIALVNCPCRMSAQLLGRTDCTHALEVCFKYDAMAEWALSMGLGREISADEAMSIMTQCEKDGLVHMVDNAKEGCTHTCNCCGHYCWNVGIIARRKIQRDALMAVYFLRATNQDECIGCGACAEVCPVSAVTMSDDDVAVVDLDWCIGCGVCAVDCPTEAISINRRDMGEAPDNFAALHAQIAAERIQTE